MNLRGALIIVLTLLIGCSIPQQFTRDQKNQVNQAFAELDTTIDASQKTKNHKPVPPEKTGPRSGWVTIDTTMQFPATVSYASAKSKIIQAARAAAVRKMIPERVSVSSLLTDMMGQTGETPEENTVWSTFALSAVSGYITDEKIVEVSPHFGNEDLFDVHLVMELYIKQVTGERDPGLALSLQLADPYLRAGETLDLTVSASQPGYLYLFNFLSDNSVVLLFPNQHQPDNYIKPNTPIDVFGEGLKYRVMPAPGENATVETLYGVLCKKPVSNLEQFRKAGSKEQIVFSAGQETYSQLQKWLYQIPLSQRTEKAVQIHIFPK